MNLKNDIELITNDVENLCNTVKKYFDYMMSDYIHDCEFGALLDIHVAMVNFYQMIMDFQKYNNSIYDDDFNFDAYVVLDGESDIYYDVEFRMLIDVKNYNGTHIYYYMNDLYNDTFDKIDKNEFDEKLLLLQNIE